MGAIGMWHKEEKLYGFDIFIMLIWGIIFSILFSIFSPGLIFTYVIYLFIKLHWSLIWLVSLLGTIIIAYISFKLSLKQLIPVLDRKKGYIEKVKLPFWLVYFFVANLCVITILYLDTFAWKSGNLRTFAHMIETMFLN
jgi:hypothetical protein